MDRNQKEISEVYNYILESSKPTEEDLKKVFTKEELIELCLKRKCKVEIWRWNVVNDYRKLFTQAGRYQRWCERERLRMLAKAVNKMKPSVLYNEEEIMKTREEEWKLQLKDNILSLNLWKRQQIKPNAPLPESDEIDSAIQMQFEIYTESITTDDLLMPSQRLDYENVAKPYRAGSTLGLQIEKNTEHEYVSEIDRKSKIETNTPSIPVKVTETTERHIIEANFDEEYSTDTECEDSLETVMLKEKEGESSEVLHSEEIAPEIENMYDMNTMSMTIDPDLLSTQSEELQTLQSQDAFSNNYSTFKSIIPMTSTQSQSQ